MKLIVVATPHGAQAGALTEVGEDHPAVGCRAEVFGQSAGEVLVGQAVETVRLYAGQLRQLGQGQPLLECRPAAVKGGVEAGELGQIGAQLLHCPDAAQAARVVQRCEGNQRLELVQQCRIDPCRFVLVGTTVHHPVAHRQQRVAWVIAGDATKQPVERLNVIERTQRDRFVAASLPAQAGMRRPQAADAAPPGAMARGILRRKTQAGGAGIERQYQGHASVPCDCCHALVG